MKFVLSLLLAVSASVAFAHPDCPNHVPSTPETTCTTDANPTKIKKAIIPGVDTEVAQDEQKPEEVEIAAVEAEVTPEVQA